MSANSYKRFQFGLSGVIFKRIFAKKCILAKQAFYNKWQNSHFNCFNDGYTFFKWRLYKTPSALALPSAKKSSETTNSSPFFVYLKISHIHGSQIFTFCKAHGPSLLSVSLLFTANKFPVSHFWLLLKFEAFTYEIWERGSAADS